MPDPDQLAAASETALCQYLAACALAVCDRWDADDVNAGLMNRDIARLRRLAKAVTNAPAEH